MSGLPGAAFFFDELGRFYRARRLHIDTDLRYVESIAATRNDKFHSAIRQYCRALRDLIADVDAKAGNGDPHEANAGDRLHEEVPRLLQALLDSLHQHLPKGFRLDIARRYHPRFSFADVHPGAHISLRAIDAIAASYHRKIAGLLPGGAAEPPLVQMTSTGEFRLILPDPAVVLGLVGTLPIEVDPVVFRSRAIRLSDLAVLSLPRWCPAHVRYAALIAHETLHRLFAFAEYVYAFLPVAEGGVEESSTIVDQLAAALGAPLLRFVSAATPLRKALVRIRGGADLHGRFLGYVSELQIDAAAFVLGGPAYVYALLPMLLSKLGTEEVLDRENHLAHPPACVRVESLCCVMEHAGFGSEASFVRRGFAQAVGHLAPRDREPPLPVFGEWVRAQRDDMLNFVDRFASLVVESVVVSEQTPVPWLYHPVNPCVKEWGARECEILALVRDEDTGKRFDSFDADEVLSAGWRIAMQDSHRGAGLAEWRVALALSRSGMLYERGDD